MKGNIEKHISPLIQHQFPEFYRTDGPIFVEFVTQYFKWLEGEYNIAVPAKRGVVSVTAQSVNVVGKNTHFTQQFADGDEIAIYRTTNLLDYEICVIDSVVDDTHITLVDGATTSFSTEKSFYGTTKQQFNPVYYARHVLDNDDLDNTAENFLVYFKEKYLKNIQLNTKTNVRQLIKHALDIYRSKGTERALDLVFRLVFGVPAHVYLPTTDIFRLSDGNWQVPRYLEISLTDYAGTICNKQIVGLQSGATAFAEAVVRRTVKGRFVDVVYISAIRGNFITGEQINTQNLEIPGNKTPTIIGSLTSLIVDSGGADYRPGDIVNLYSNNGEQGEARVSSVEDVTGRVNFTLIDGGYGYSNTADVVVSEATMVIANVEITEDEGRDYFWVDEEVVQPLANIHYITANGTFVNGEHVFTYNDDYHLTVALANNAGSGYVPGDVLTIANTGDTHTIVEATVNVSTTEVKTITLVGVGTGGSYYPNDKLQINTGTASVNAYANIVSTKVRTVAVNVGGSGYANGDTVSLNDGTHSVDAIFTVTTGVADDIATSLVLTQNGVFTVNPASLTGVATANVTGSGTGLTVDVTFRINAISAIEERGSFTVNPTLTAGATTLKTGATGDGTGATATVAMQIETMTVLNSGDYTLLPNVTANALRGGTGSAATGKLTMPLDISQKGEGIIFQAQASNSTAGEFDVAVLSGNLNVTDIFNTANAIGAVVSLYVDMTATGNVVAQRDITFQVTGANTFIVGEEIYQKDAFDYDTATANIITWPNLITLGATDGDMKIQSGDAVFVNGPVYGRQSNAQATIVARRMTVGVYNIVNQFVNSAGNWIYGNSSGATGYVANVFSGGVNADFAVSSDLLYPETITISNDLLKDYLSVHLNNTTFGFPTDPGGNLTSNTISNMLNMQDIVVGKIKLLIRVNPGVDYDNAPLVRITDQLTAPWLKLDTIRLPIANLNGSYQVGELVTQSDNDSRGLVMAANTSELVVQRLRWYDANNITITSNATTMLVGSDSSSTANVTDVIPVFSSNVLGNDAFVTANLAIGANSVVTLDVIDSGFGYITNEEVIFGVSIDAPLTGTALVELGTAGAGVGRYKQMGGELSGQKRLFDGLYWQDYSYEVRASVTLDKYEAMLKQLLHVTGTKYFGALFHKSVGDITVTPTATVVTQT